MNYYTAKKYADRIVELLTPHCARIDIAGSIRRLRADVKDIEIVCEPKKKFMSTDLFGGGYWLVDQNFRLAVASIAHQIIKGKYEGRYMQIKLKGKESIILDLFTPEPIDYYRQLAIRTGSADYSAKVLAHAWVQKGWCGTTNAGLRMQKHCIKTASGWQCQNLNDDLHPEWKSEKEFFEWLGLSWVEPQNRIA